VSDNGEDPVLQSDFRPELSRRAQALEVGAFLFLIVPSSILSLFAVGKGTQGFVVTAVSVIMRDLALASLVLYFLWRNREPLSAIGWTTKDCLQQAGLGVLLFPLIFVGIGLFASQLTRLGLSHPHSQLQAALSVKGLWQAPLAILLVLVVAVTEETIFRGYLLLRFTAISRSTSFATLLSTVVFATGHGYEGEVGVAAVALLGLVFAVMYLRTGSLIAPIVVHFLQDFIAVVVVPLFTNGK
jgi:uncharacterized protein